MSFSEKCAQLFIMNWEIISVVTEVVGTITIVVTLIYVLMQIRLNSHQLERTVQATRTQNWQSVAVNFNTWRDMVLASNNADIWLRGLNDLNNLNSVEKMKFNMIAGSYIWTCWYVFQIQKNEGLMGDANNHLYRDLYKHEGYRDWLSVNKKLHSDDFGDFLDEVERTVGTERYQIGESSSLTAGIY